MHLPDVSSKQVFCGGSVRLNKDIYLKDVLLVPGFTHNLLSIAQLVKDSKAKCTFMPGHCLLQRQETDGIMGIGKMLGNLYVIEIVMENHYCNLFNPKVMTVEKWHIFLGHPSITTLKHMKMFSGQFTDSVIEALENCEVCLQAKRVRDEFPILNKRSDELFELIHADIWGSIW